MAKIQNWGIGLGVAAALALVPGCATKKYVSGEVQKSSTAAEKHISEVESQIEQTQTAVSNHEQRIQELDKSTKDALDRASEAGKLAQGKFNYSIVLSDDKAHFPLNRHELSTEAKSELDEFVDHLKSDDKNVYLEIQGHTDATGTRDLQHAAGRRTRRGRAPLPQSEGRGAQSHGNDFLRRDGARRLEQDEGRAIEESPGRDRRPELTNHYVWTVRPGYRDGTGGGATRRPFLFVRRPADVMIRSSRAGSKPNARPTK